MELLEPIAVATIVGVSIAAISLGITAKATRRQTKVKSAELILSFLERLRDDDFRKTTDYIFDGTKPDNWNEAIEIEKMLNHFEYIAALNKDGTLDLGQIKEFFKANLERIRDNQQVQQIMQNAIKKDPDFTYKNLKKLLDKI